MKMNTTSILNYLDALAKAIEWNSSPIDILLIGGSAGMLTGQLPPLRITQDCDMADCCPPQAQQAILNAAAKVAMDYGLPQTWLNAQAMHALPLPDGWQSRKQQIARFDSLAVYAIGRLDLLAMKFYANRPHDRQDIIEMKPSPDEFYYCRRYLDSLRTPSRKANLDQIVSAMQCVDAIEELFYGK